MKILVLLFHTVERQCNVEQFLHGSLHRSAVGAEDPGLSLRLLTHHTRRRQHKLVIKAAFGVQQPKAGFRAWTPTDILDPCMEVNKELCAKNTQDIDAVWMRTPPLPPLSFAMYLNVSSVTLTPPSCKR